MTPEQLQILMGALGTATALGFFFCWLNLGFKQSRIDALEQRLKDVKATHNGFMEAWTHQQLRFIAVLINMETPNSDQYIVNEEALCIQLYTHGNIVNEYTLNAAQSLYKELITGDTA